MHVSDILHNQFKACRAVIDLRLLNTLFDVVEALTRSRKLTIASLGRSLKRDCAVKHKIKTVDRLFGNLHLQYFVPYFYKQMLSTIIGNNLNPIIIVDWSGLTRCGKFHFIRAAVPLGGRALPILELPFALEHYGSQKAHKLFLKQLKELLPKNCCPLILTDAGFRNPWFKLVLSLGWDYVGRIRHDTLCQSANSQWMKIKLLYSHAKTYAQYLGNFKLAKKNPIKTNFYIYKEIKKNRVKRNLAGKKIRCSVSLKHGKSGAEPWLLATSLNQISFNATQIMSIYNKRMQIEESIRDLKSERGGLSLRQNRCASLGRLSVTLLIGAMTNHLLWVVGIAAKNKKFHYHYQANTVRHYNVLSIFTIGWQVLEEMKHTFSNAEINQAVKELEVYQYA